MLDAARQLQERFQTLDPDQQRAPRKACLVIAEFGVHLVETPLLDLKRMAHSPCRYDNKLNLLCLIWDKYRFLPTADLLRSMGGEDFPPLSPLISVLDQIWT